MIGSDSGSFYTVTDPEQARLLTEPASKNFFKPFLACERSAAEAAALLPCGLNTMLYRIKTFLRAGLLKVTHERRRKGRAVKVYRSVHDAYFVPFRVTPYATLEERLWVQAEPIFAGLIHAYEEALRQNERYGHHIFVGENGAVWTSDLLPEVNPNGQPIVYANTTVRLRAEDARTLGRELRALFERAMRLGAQVGDDEAAETYLYMLTLLPFEEPYRT